MDDKKIIFINGPVIKAQGEANFAMHDMVLVGNLELMGEVISLEKDIATIQVYEETSGLTIGEKVVGTGEALSVELGPGLIGSVLDGIGRDLVKLKSIDGDFINRGKNISSMDFERKWNVTLNVNLGQEIDNGNIIATIKETESVEHRIIYQGKKAKVVNIVQNGEYTVKDIIAEVEIEDELNNVEIQKITMCQKWPVRKQRKYAERISVSEPLITGQRVIDSIFPIAKGGTAAIPGGFGTGKTMLQHQIAKWCDADIIVYVGCGERGNEMTQVLEDFPKLVDPRTNRPLMERTILIANTSNMPVAAREASIYTGITIAEYYRDMGYNVAMMADSTSRWAEALREISGRLEEMPAEEGFPSYLPSRLSEFYGRAGVVKTFNGKIGSISMIGAVSPQGSDFSEPVTQNTKRFVHVFWGLDRDLAYSRHYPAVNWNISYSNYINNLENWYKENIEEDFMILRQDIISILEEENSLLEIAKVVGQDVLDDSKKLIIEVGRAIRVGFLQQNANSEIDTYVPIKKQYKMMQSILKIYYQAKKVINKGIPISIIKELGIFEKYEKLKLEVKNDDIQAFDKFQEESKQKLNNLEKEYEEHLT